MFPATVEQHEWQVRPTRRLLVKDGFADADGNPNFDLPTTVMRVGMEEGLKVAMGQIDAILAG